MKLQNPLHGVVHRLSPDIAKLIMHNSDALYTWNDITPLSRNEWICWIESAKKSETRTKRIKQAIENLTTSKRRPCCWAGCGHRKLGK